MDIEHYKNSAQKDRVFQLLEIKGLSLFFLVEMVIFGRIVATAVTISI